MTGRTHDLAAFTLLNAVFILQPLTTMSLATLVVTVGANFIGGLAPDLDRSSASLWKSVRGGGILSKLIAPLLGGHRLISHSLLGLVIAGWLFNYLLEVSSHALVVDSQIVWWGFVLGLISHLLADSLTKEGVPLLFPLGWRFGLPPIKSLRLTTGKRVEMSLIYPGLMLVNGYWFFTYSAKYLDFLRHYLK